MVGAPETCDPGTVNDCGVTLSECMSLNSDPTAVCFCRGAYDTCIYQAGCPPGTISAVVAACKESGCSAAQVCVGFLLCVTGAMVASHHARDVTPRVAPGARLEA
ncbi:MAG: hypothetical protein P4L40_01910 [Terracidiphilus sp.]|nr:hypothetical protein [Terracidiphilus sp.]